MKKHFIPIAIGVQIVISTILAIVGYNIRITSTQNILFFSALIICTAFWSIVFGISKNGVLKGTAIGFTGICILITLLNCYALLDSNFGWSRNATFSEVVKNVSSTSELVYQSDYTKLYVDIENKRLYSISDIKTGTGQYFYQTNLSPQDESEYKTLYSTGIKLTSLSNKIPEIVVHPTTISTLTGYEQLFELKIDDVIYIAPTFFMGKFNVNDDTFDKIVDIKYGDNGIQNYEVYKMQDGNLFIQNNLSAFITPCVNVQYDSNIKFQNRFTEYMQAFNNGYSLPAELTFGFFNSIEGKGDNIERVSFYYEIYNMEIQGGSLMEIVYKDGTADVAYVKEMYAENLTAVMEAN